MRCVHSASSGLRHDIPILIGSLIRCGVLGSVGMKPKGTLLKWKRCNFGIEFKRPMDVGCGLGRRRGPVTAHSAAPNTASVVRTRYSWFFTHGVMPPRNIDVCHRCDNRLCVRPDHLFLGTRRDNMQDAVAKGKVKSGERHYRAKLTQEQADHIRQFKAQGISTTDLVFMFGVSQATVSLVCRGERWKASV